MYSLGATGAKGSVLSTSRVLVTQKSGANGLDYLRSFFCHILYKEVLNRTLSHCLMVGLIDSKLKSCVFVFPSTYFWGYLVLTISLVNLYV